MSELGHPRHPRRGRSTRLSPAAHAAGQVDRVDALRTVVTGEVDRGVVAVGDPVEIVGLGPTRPTVVISIESFDKTADRAMAGDNTAMLLRGVRRGEVTRGHVIGAPGSITPHARF
jgi:translation elongation factor EF-Tu-like GTPase